MKSPTSDNLIHWDYLLKCEGVHINVVGTHRAVQINIHGKVNDDGWRALVENFRSAYSASARKKAAVQKKLEEWSVFINRYAELCSEAALHYDKIFELQDFQFKPPSIDPEKGMIDEMFMKSILALSWK